ncbi:MAG: hypothetical protein RR998_01020 [Oscillospiraceae bacterium]
MAEKKRNVAAIFRPIGPIGVQTGISDACVAVIAGAVACVLGPNATVTDIKRSSKPETRHSVVDGRSAWRAAGLSEVTRPFSGR